MSRAHAYLLTAVVLCTSAGAALAEQHDLDDALRTARRFETQRIRLIEQVSPAVICILNPQGSGTGSGVIIDPQGFALTNFHVIAPMMESRQAIAGLQDGNTYPFRVLGVDITGDVAMVKLDGPYRAGGPVGEFPCARFGDSDTARVGDWALVLGDSFGQAEDFTPAASFGIITGSNRYQHGRDQKLIYTDCLQTDAAINPGNSGGPLFDFTGRVIGINGRASFEARGRVNVGLGYAISINQVKRFIPALRAGLLAEHGQIGATVYDDPVAGVAVDQIAPGSPAWQAGIRLDDRLIEFAGRPIASQNQFLNVQGTFPANWPVPIVFEHEGQQCQATVRLQRIPVDLGPLRFEVDRQWNRAQAWRVLRLHREHTGGERWRQLTELVWRAERTADDHVAHLAFRETPTGEATMTAFRDAACSEARSVTRYDGQSAVIQRGETERRLPDRPAAILNVARTMRWLLAGVDLQGEPDVQWSHAGGDALDGDILEVLEYRPPEQRESAWRVGFDSETWQWRLLEFVGPEAKTIRLLFGDHRPVQGLQLPHSLVCLIDEQPSFRDAISDYELTFAE